MEVGSGESIAGTVGFTAHRSGVEAERRAVRRPRERAGYWRTAGTEHSVVEGR